MLNDGRELKQMHLNPLLFDCCSFHLQLIKPSEMQIFGLTGKELNWRSLFFLQLSVIVSPIVDSLPYIFSPEQGSPLSNVDRKGIESGPWEERTETCGVLTNQIEGKGEG